MDYEVTSINSGVGSDWVNVTLQSVSTNGGPSSNLTLVLPVAEAGSYTVGTVYTLSLTAK